MPSGESNMPSGTWRGQINIWTCIEGRIRSEHREHMQWQSRDAVNALYEDSTNVVPAMPLTKHHAPADKLLETEAIDSEINRIKSDLIELIHFQSSYFPSHRAHKCVRQVIYILGIFELSN